MSNPCQENWEALKRLGRYLIGRERATLKFGYRSNYRNVHVYSDSDHAGCRRTRKSTSGGVIMLGTHTVKTWSNTQGVIALSSGEAEFYSMVKAGPQATGMVPLMGDMELCKGIVLKTDASAAKGITSRRGLGKVRHLEVNQLWIQEKVIDGSINVIKIPTHENLSDALTKPVASKDLEYHMKGVGLTITAGRHILMPSITHDG